MGKSKWDTQTIKLLFLKKRFSYYILMFACPNISLSISHKKNINFPSSSWLTLHDILAVNCACSRSLNSLLHNLIAESVETVDICLSSVWRLNFPICSPCSCPPGLFNSSKGKIRRRIFSYLTL